MDKDREAGSKVYPIRSVDFQGRFVPSIELGTKEEGLVRKALSEVSGQIPADSFGELPPMDLPEGPLSDSQIAIYLSRIEVKDPHLKKLDPQTDDGLAEAAMVASRKAKLAAEATSDAKRQKELGNFGNKVVDWVTKALATRMDRRQFMKKSAVVLTAVTLSACGFNPTSTVAPDITPVGPTATEVSPTTIPPTPTIEPTPVVLNFLPQGDDIKATATPEGGNSRVYNLSLEKGDQRTLIPDTTVDDAGFHFPLRDGTRVDIPGAEMTPQRLVFGQGDVLQIYSPDGTHIDYAFDAVEGVWLAHDEVIHTDVRDFENYIQVSTWADLETLFRQEKMFMLPFPPDTYWPDEVYWDYLSPDAPQTPSPLGNPPDLGKKPTRYVNFTILRAGEDRSQDFLIVSEQVYNPVDNSFSVLHFFDRDEDIGRRMVVEGATNHSAYLLPFYEFPPEDFSAIKSYYQDIVDSWVRAGYYNGQSLEVTGIENLVEIWLTTGKVPEELEKLPLIGYPAFFMPGQ